MPDRHSELPARPDLEYYRKQAKHLLRSYEAGDAAARDRAAEPPPPDRPVVRLWAAPGSYASWADGPPPPPRCLGRRAARRAADHRPGARLRDLAGARGGRRESPAR